MKCPACKQAMIERDFGGVGIDVCESGCHGLWFDWDELPGLDEPHEGFGRALDEALAQSATAKRRGSLTCPGCQRLMQEHRYGGAPAVVVDECYGCRGLFLDPGELGAIRDHFTAQATAGRRAEPLGTILIQHPPQSGDHDPHEERARTRAVIEVCEALMRRLRPYGF